ncbi:MAG: glycosyl transferase [Candidatus Spechtbacteria bacterium RIFCSPLOWO2_01_FULL_43_12]|uniref:Glycosyl transferase n=1 Tax=Candidatus Spechtbacteria bacterium RIFCSPLOWO2_01_FULL_43_12 TaxID=1802162 RepID=A0A1G2HDQ9_9BACT|nr:MAG: glycosyl transferase [Candidatus Spechtbacteria bacterium RIFCSPLOWO2_01_FULL_43_12]
MKVALVHDYLVQYGGAERVLEEFAYMFPKAPIYTLVYDEKATGSAFKGRDIRTSFLQKIPKRVSTYRFFPLLMPMAVESFDLTDYDLVISSSASFAKGIITREGSLHISYCHSPMRYAWLDYKKIAGDSLYPSYLEKFIPLIMPYMRVWDRQSAQRPDHILTNSNFIRRKLKKYYSREAHVIYPPLNFNKFYISAPKDYFLIVGRMVPYKRFDIAIKAFNDLKLPLKVVGSGPEYKNLKSMAGPNIEFLGLVSEKDLAKYYSEARAFIFPQEEDFGITALESMASGRPVIAYGRGGVLESVKEGETGIFFNDRSAQALKNAVKEFENITFDPEKIRKHAEKFDTIYFRRQVADFVIQKVRESRKIIIT